jgi:hypothetical protein
LARRSGRAWGLVSLLAAAIVAVIALLLIFGRNTEDAGAGGASRSASPPVSGEPSEFSTDDPVQVAESAIPQALGDASGAGATPSPNGVTSLRVRVTWAADKSPAAGIGLQIYSWSEPGGAHRNVRRVTTDARGEWFASPVSTGSVAVHTDRDKFQGTTIESGQAALIDIALPPGFNVSGVVKDAQGEPVAEAEVWMSMAQNDHEGQVVARSDAQGRFALRDLRVGGRQVLAARSSTHAPSPKVSVEGKLGETEQAVLVLGGDCGGVRGVVVDPGGAAVPGARVRIGQDAGLVLWGGNYAPTFDLRCDAQGAFLAEGLPVGSHSVTAAAPGWSPTARATGLVDGKRMEMTGVLVEAGQTADVTLQLQPSASLSGIARDEMGRPVQWATVSTVDAGSYLELMRAEAITEADGHYELHDLPLASVNLLAQHEKAGRATTRLKFEAGKVLTWDPQLTFGGHLAGTLLDARDRPVFNRHVSALATDRHQPERGSAETDASGHFEMSGLSLGPQDIFVSVPGAEGTISLARGVAVGRMDLVLRLPENADAPAIVVGRVVDPFGVPASGFQVWITNVDSRSPQLATLEDGTGRFLLEGLAPGQYVAKVEADPAPRVLSAPLAVAGGQTCDFGDLVLAPGGRVSVMLAAPGEIVERRMNAMLVAETGNLGDRLQRDGERWISSRVPAGRYTLVLQSTDFASLRRSVLVEDGRDTLVEVSLRSGVQQSLRILGVHPTSGEIGFALSIQTVDGEVVVAYPTLHLRAQTDPPPPGAPVYENTFCLAPGNYLVDASLGDKSKTGVALSTSPGSPWEIDLR